VNIVRRRGAAGRWRGPGAGHASDQPGAYQLQAAINAQIIPPATRVRGRMPGLERHRDPRRCPMLGQPVSPRHGTSDAWGGGVRG